MSCALSKTVRSDNDVQALTLAEKKEILRRFNERVDAAVSSRPPSKSWVKTALTLGGAPRCPVRLRRLSLDIILRYGDALADLFCEYPDDAVTTFPYDMFVGYQPSDRPNRLDPVKILTENAQWADEWGTQWRHAAGGVGASTISNPLADWSQLDGYLAQRMPDPRAPGRLEGMLPSLRAHGKTRYFFGTFHMLLFERLHCLRGMDNTFADFHLYPGEVSRLLDALTDYTVELVRCWGQLDDVDGLLMTDDWGTQTSLMIAPAMWRKFFAARYRRIFDEVHRFGKQVLFHSCGNVTKIIGDLIDVGVDVVDPIQPEAMDLAEVAENFGGKVAFSGGISDQKLVQMTPPQVRDSVCRTIKLMGKRFNNAYLVAPSNYLTPEIPLENLRALFEAVHR
jgi:uroporphyrinogen decarboxylase